MKRVRIFGTDRAFAGEAVSSAGFPVQGTLFSAFSGSRGTLLVFLLALWSPLFASVAVAVTARKWSLVPYSVLIGCAILFAHLRLQRKSYFRALNPRLINALFSKSGVNDEDHRNSSKATLEL